MSFHIAIDGPVAAGKGTVARLVAEQLNMLYIYTGAMYRMVALLAARNSVALSDEDALVTLIDQSVMEMRQPTEHERDSRLITVLLNGEDVSWAIQTEEAAAGGSKVAVLPKVREHLVAKQQQLAAGHDVVMEGRDITYRVLPNAELKIYLTASVEARAARRYQELQRRGIATTLDAVRADLQARDRRDRGRMADPLQKVAGVWELDTTNMSVDEVVKGIVNRVQQLKGIS